MLGLLHLWPCANLAGQNLMKCCMVHEMKHPIRRQKGTKSICPSRLLPTFPESSSYTMLYPLIFAVVVRLTLFFFGGPIFFSLYFRSVWDYQVPAVFIGHPH